MRSTMCCRAALALLAALLCFLASFPVILRGPLWTKSLDLLNLLRTHSSHRSRLITSERGFLVGHNGAGRSFPENSLPAFRAAVIAMNDDKIKSSKNMRSSIFRPLGCTAIEIDVRVTSDGKLAAFHDETVDRKTNGTGLVAELSMDQLKKLNVACSWCRAAATATAEQESGRVLSVEYSTKERLSSAGLKPGHVAAICLSAGCFGRDLALLGTGEPTAALGQLHAPAAELALGGDDPLLSFLAPEVSDWHIKELSDILFDPILYDVPTLIELKPPGASAIQPLVRMLEGLAAMHLSDAGTSSVETVTPSSILDRVVVLAFEPHVLLRVKQHLGGQIATVLVITDDIVFGICREGILPLVLCQALEITRVGSLLNSAALGLGLHVVPHIVQADGIALRIQALRKHRLPCRSLLQCQSKDFLDWKLVDQLRFRGLWVDVWGDVNAAEMDALIAYGVTVAPNDLPPPG